MCGDFMLSTQKAACVGIGDFRLFVGCDGDFSLGRLGSSVSCTGC